MKMQQSGFTLIELVVVITILGILAAFALPRFAGLEKDARSATIQGLAGSIRAAAALAHSIQLVKGYTSGTSVTMEGTVVSMTHGYPDTSGIASALQSYDGFSFSAGTFTAAGASNGGACKVVYSPQSGGAPPTVTPYTTGC